MYFHVLQDTFKIQTQRAFLDVYLADGRYLRIDIQTSDTAERVLEVVSYKIELSRELLGYFSLFLIQDHNDGKLSVLKKLAEFELPYVAQEIEKNWLRPTDGQMQKLQMLQKAPNKMKIELPEPDKAKKASIHPSQIFHSGFKPRKKIPTTRSSEDDCVFEKISEEDL
ncbi:hypothetical protein JD844_015875 [Phrynosoma platyrhinos]|uniref:Sortin nexin 17/31 FERM domain-containing protein n=1 Tax=Phrynosoma platyrhinos TaxID=52577 RepID=A0ABQ7SJN2_PHRPL|nr:hypothetical protein JD844_015875 [Phrynosoma platyrhinos]